MDAPLHDPHPHPKSTRGSGCRPGARSLAQCPGESFGQRRSHPPQACCLRLFEPFRQRCWFAQSELSFILGCARRPWMTTDFRGKMARGVWLKTIRDHPATWGGIRCEKPLLRTRCDLQQKRSQLCACAVSPRWPRPKPAGHAGQPHLLSLRFNLKFYAARMPRPRRRRPGCTDPNAASRVVSRQNTIRYRECITAGA